MQCFQEFRVLPSLIRTSGAEIKKVASLTGCAMLTALNVVISQFRIVVSNLLEINFASVMAGVSALYYGPLLTAAIGGIADILKFIARPSGPFFPGFTINEIVLGFLYGCFFYKKEITLKRVIFARLCVVLIINMCLTPLWLSMLYGKAFWVLFTARIIKNIVLFPVDVALLYMVLKAAQRTPYYRRMSSLNK